MKLISPPKLYLDTNHLINIADLRKGRLKNPRNAESYAFIDHCIRDRHFGLIFNPSAPLEWVDGDATLQRALEIAAVVDSAPLQYELEIDQFIFLHELVEEIRRIDPRLRLPTFDILVQRNEGRPVTRALSVLAKQVPGYFDEGDLPFSEATLPENDIIIPATSHVRYALRMKTENPTLYRERVDGHNWAYRHDVAAVTRHRKNTEKRTAFICWMKSFPRLDRVVAALNPDVDVDELLAQVDATRCPAVNLFMLAHDKRIRNGAQPKHSDVGDWMFLSGVPYADLVLTEKILCHFIRQADRSVATKVTYDPMEATKILAQWT